MELDTTDFHFHFKASEDEGLEPPLTGYDSIVFFFFFHLFLLVGG